MTIFRYTDEAFDSVCHGTLISKLDRLGFWEDVLRLIRSYLENRRLIFRTDSGVRQSAHEANEVPQGSSVGPNHFALLIDDLLQSIPDCRIVSFADDTT